MYTADRRSGCEEVLLDRTPIDRGSWTHEEYWRLFGNLIISADLAAFAACVAWILFWLDNIPDHIFHSHGITLVLFIASFASASFALFTTVRTRNHLGAPKDRIWHLVEIIYAFFASITGITAYLLNPPV